MIKALSLVAALAVLPAAPAFAQDGGRPTAASVCSGEEAFEAPDVDIDDEDLEALPSVQRLEQAAAILGEKMESFGPRADAVCDDEALTAEQREQRIASLWSEYQPHLDAFTAEAATLGAQIAVEVLAQIDIGSIVAEAMTEVNESGAMANAMQGAAGIAQNSAWTSNDPEHMATMGLVAQYAAGEAIDAIDEARAEQGKLAAPKSGD
ncbi:hypothetical protein ACIQC9_12230 [Brevundimonas sp. NPDC092305]|uniref:hypothetical protein n=1 Tax=Brevundimonas sp. NPDC092305 TaxID=3363957 RepID=UPI003809D07A